MMGVRNSEEFAKGLKGGSDRRFEVVFEVFWRWGSVQRLALLLWSVSKYFPLFWGGLWWRGVNGKKTIIERVKILPR